MAAGITGANLTDVSDEDLKAWLRDQGSHVLVSHNMVRGELDRRGANRQARATNIASTVAIVISVVSLIVTAANG